MNEIKQLLHIIKTHGDCPIEVNNCHSCIVGGDPPLNTTRNSCTNRARHKLKEYSEEEVFEAAL